jgi:hypothetical protein
MCKRTEIRRDEIPDKTFRNVYAEIGVRRTAGCKNKGHGRK